VVRKWVRNVCVKAGVPKVTAHGMRGLHSTLALEHGASSHVVASSLGHESFSTTLQSYAKPEAVAGAKQRRVMTVLEGGEATSSTAAA
jgi:integrase